MFDILTVAPGENAVAEKPLIAYFTMEIGVHPDLPTYSGGLGVLAGDTIKAAADLGLPLVAVTLLHRKGYFHQRLDPSGKQSESDVQWNPADLLERLPHTVQIKVEGRNVQVGVWRYKMQGTGRHCVSIYFLDTRISENDPYDQTLTDTLYGGDPRYRLCQETVLGIGGVAMLRALRLDSLQVYHMNEGHSALLTYALLEEQSKKKNGGEISEEAIDAVRAHCVFTTHTPVPAGHDQFPHELAVQVVGERVMKRLEQAGVEIDGTLNMTLLGLRFSRYINGVAMRHREVSSGMFPNYPIDSITNGIHALTWITDPMARLYDKYVPEWRRDTLYLRYAVSIPLDEMQTAHREAKRELLAEVESQTGVKLREEALTIGFARRATTYKRADLLFSDLDRLRGIARKAGPLQIVYAGKAHPRDEEGKKLILRIHEAARALGEDVRVVYLPNYGMRLGRLLCGGVDCWLNNPRKPQEASGTSGMKAAANGVPSFSVLDGWWIEGHFEGVTGWAIGDEARVGDDRSEANSLYDKLETVILPLYYQDPDGWGEVMRAATALNGSFFSAQRMIVQYVRNAYRTADPVQLDALLRQS